MPQNSGDLVETISEIKHKAYVNTMTVLKTYYQLFGGKYSSRYCKHPFSAYKYRRINPYDERFGRAFKAFWAFSESVQ